MKYIGSPVLRVEDQAILRGLATYTGDINRADMLEVAFSRSWAAHGLIKAININDARKQQNVAGVWSSKDLDFPLTPPSALNVPPSGMTWPSLATEKVRYVGEPVAIVAADDRYAAEDAVALVELEIDPLPAVLDATEAADDAAPSLFEGQSNVVLEGSVGGDLEEEFSHADVVIEGIFRHPRLSHMALEGRAFLAIPRAGGLDVYCSHQAPHRLHKGLCEALALSPNHLRVRVPHVGGAFGGKSQIYPEYVAIAHLALHLKRPLKWIEDRAENLVAGSHGRGQNLRMWIAATRDGKIKGVKAELDTDAGAYPHTGSFLSRTSASFVTGPYNIPRASVRFRSVLTNAVPTTPYRGAGRPEPTFALEVMIDRLAEEIGMDPAELRARNFVSASDFPYTTATGQTYDSGDYLGALEAAIKRSRPSLLVPAPGSTSLVASGIATFVDSAGGVSSPSEFGSVSLQPDGRMAVKSGSVSSGQGHHTTFAQIVASVFDLHLDAISVVQGDSNWPGIGTFASRSLQFGGSAVLEAARALFDQVADKAAEILEVSREDLAYKEGSFRVRGAPSQNVTLAMIGQRYRLTCEEQFSGSRTTPFGCYVATLSVDEETGKPSLVNFVAVDDCGNTVNPLIVEGQAHGSIAQGVGGTLFESIVYDDFGQPLTTSMMDYLAPTMSEIPPIELATTVTPTPSNPLGAKGAGEAGCVGAPAALANALQAVLRQAGGSMPEMELPLSPEKIWKALGRRQDRPGG